MKNLDSAPPPNTVMTKSVSVLIAVLMSGCSGGFALSVLAAPLPELVIVRGTQAGMNGPNLMADSSFESLNTRAFTLDTPFRVAADPHAHSGKADVQATLSRSGKRMYSYVSVWKNTDVSSIWLRGSGSGTLFVATANLSKRLASTATRAARC